MQTTLLGLAVAIILALVAALVGPLFVDWGRWRASFETEATRLVGMPVRVSGRIDARLLPTPSLQLNGIEVGPADAPKLQARSLGVEFALGSLMRGEWRAAELHLDGPQLTLGVDADGRIDVPQVAIGFDPDRLSFDRVVVDDGRAVLLHAASDTRVVLDRLSFKGDVRSLIGPFKGEGGFVAAGVLYGYSISGGRRDDGGGLHLHVALDPSDRPLTIETDGTAAVDNGHLRYDGSITLARLVGFALPDGTTIASDPWRATSRIRATSTSALLEQVEFQYGPDERAIKLAGTAELSFGAKPRFDGVLSARQIDLDRAFLAPDAAQRTPIALLRRMTAGLFGLGAPPIPVKIGIGVDNVTLGGGTLIAVRGDLVAAAGTWSLDSLEFRAPGATQVEASGRLVLPSGAGGFAGPASVDSTDPKALIAWLEGRSVPDRVTLGPLRLRGDLALGAERLAVDRLKAELDRKSFDGRLAYAFATDRHPARLDAALNAAQMDLDDAIGFATNALAGTAFERPGEIALALDLGRASYAGVDAKGVTANLKFDASGLDIERLAIADVGGALLNASGRIDTTSASPHGTITVALDAQRLTGLAALAGRFAPAAADMLNTLSQRAAPAKLSAKLDVAPTSAATDATTSAKLTVDGVIAGMHVALQAEGDGTTAAPSAATVRLDGHVETDDGARLAALTGLDRFATLERRSAKLAVTASGPANGALQVDASFGGAGLDATARGKVRIADARPYGALDVTFTVADARLPRRDPASAMPVTLSTHVALDGDRIGFEALDGKVAGASVKGRLALALGQPTHIEGKLDADTVDATAVMASAIGAPVAGAHGAWSSEPFAAAPLAGMEGKIDVTAAHATLTSGIAVEQLRASVQIAPTSVAFNGIEAILGEGRLAAQVEFRAAPTGVSTTAHVSLANADLATLLPRAAVGQASGRVSLQLDAGGTGLSPAALVGALQGGGNASAENLQLSGFDPRAIDAALRAADRGVAIDTVRIGDIVRTALETGRLHIPDAAGTVAIGDGRITLSPLSALAEGADVGLSGSYALADDALDLRFDLTGPPQQNMPGGQRPALTIALKGPLAAPRRSADVGALVNWLTMRRIDLEAKRLEAAEQEAKRIKAQEDEARRRAAEDAARRAAEEAARRARETATTSSVAPTFDRAPVLPPPVDIAPPPGAPERKVRRAIPPPAPPLAITPDPAR